VKILDRRELIHTGIALIGVLLKMSLIGGILILVITFILRSINTILENIL